MEIVIDLAAVQSIVAHEYGEARAQLRAHGAVAAYRASQQRHDERLAGAADAGTLACSAGCSWCCHFTVDVRPIEVLAILQFVERHFSVSDSAALRTRLETNRQVLHGLDEEQRMQHNVTCAFLQDGRCSIYPVRPQTCRNYHATDAEGCRQSYEEPTNLEIDPDFAPLVYQTGGAHVEAFNEAVAQQGHDVAAYEMNAALTAALLNPQETSRRFDARLPMFPHLPSTDVPPEFLETEMLVVP